MASLSPQEIDTYRERGYVVPSFRLPPARVARLRRTLDRLLEANRGVRPEKLVSAHIEGRNDEGVVGSAEFLELARDPDIVDLVEQLIGPDVILWGCQIFCKPGGDGLEVPFHQDGEYWPIRPLANCTAWIAIDDSTRENGCLRVVPGSHRAQRIFEHTTEARDDVVLTQKVKQEFMGEQPPDDVELAVGQMSLHDVFMIHGSNANRSGRRRAGVAVRYMPATSHFNRALIERTNSSGYVVDFSTRPLWLLRGVDACGKNDFEIGHPKQR